MYGKGALVLSWWKVDFDPQITKLSKRHLCVVLPGFPLFYWNIKWFCVVKNEVGKFIHIEESHLMGSE